MPRTIGQSVSRIVAAFVVAAVFTFGSAASACPNCKGNVAANDRAESAQLGAGFSYSVLFMMAMPFVLAGGFGVACWVHVRRVAQPAQPGQPAPHGQPSGSAGPDEPFA